MENEIKVIYEGEFVKVISNGEKDFKFAKKCWTSVVKVCKEKNIYRVLGISNTITPISPSEAYNHPKLFKELGINLKYKIAWVELNSEFNDIYEYTEIVLSNREFPGKLFTCIEEAKRWLLK